MTLGIRKLLVIALVGCLVLAGNLMLIANWLQQHGVIDIARDVRQEFLSGTAITILAALLILLVPNGNGGRHGMGRRQCPVCEGSVRSSARYCDDCGSKL